jgi:hypothetical protein
VLSVVNAQFHNRALPGGYYKAGIVVWLMFIPAMIFGLLTDLEIFVQVKAYKPIAIKHIPRYTKEILLVVSCLSFLTSIALIFVSFIAFTPVVSPRQTLKIFYVILFAKSILWSPFIALEFYETVFENVYYDVQWQLNPIEPSKQKRTFSVISMVEDDDELITTKLISSSQEWTPSNMTTSV